MPELRRPQGQQAGCKRRGSAAALVRTPVLTGLVSVLALVALPCPARAAGMHAAGTGTGAAVPAPLPVEGPPVLSMPVQGMAPQDLRDTYADQRAGGVRVHEALDILAPRGTPVLAVDSGRIAKLFLSKPGGITLYQFDATGRFAYYYAHLDGYAPGMAEGQAVQRGQLLGYVGSTGNANPEAPHLHFGIFRLGADQRWWEGVPINPFPLLRPGSPNDAGGRARAGEAGAAGAAAKGALRP